MRRLVVSALAAAAAAWTAASAPLDPATCTEEEVRAAMAAAFAPTNADVQSVYQYTTTSGVFAVLSTGRFPALRAELDATLAARDLAPGHFWCHPDTYPRSAAVRAAHVGALEAYPATFAMCERLGCPLYPYGIVNRGGGLDDLLVFLSEAVAFPERCTRSAQVFSSLRTHIQAQALRAVKRHIRSQGRSFVTKDGVNPCEEYMARLTAALNAPRFAGLDAWLKDLGLAGVDLSRMPSEEEVAKFKEAVFYGDQPMDVRAQALLEVCLGIEGYNAFVREYNGE